MKTNAWKWAGKTFVLLKNDSQRKHLHAGAGLWHSKKQLEFYKKNGNRYYVSLYKGIVYSFEERFRDLNEDIDVLSYFGEANAQA